MSARRRATGRERRPQLLALRLWFGVASRLAPTLAERQAARLFLTPRRRRPARSPEVGGASGRAFTLGVEGLTLAGWSFGNGPAVLLVHGWSGSGADMASMAGALARAGFRAVLFDMPAHGRSAGRRTSIIEWLTAIGAIEQTLGGFHAVVGHSLGGTATTLALAEGLGARGAVLLAPPRTPEEFAERYRRFIGLQAERVDGMLRRVVERIGRDLPLVDASRAAARLAMPALIVHDPQDHDVPWSHGQAIADAWRGSRMVPAEGLGHYGILDDPGTIAMVVSFVEQLPRSVARPERGRSATT